MNPFGTPQIPLFSEIVHGETTLYDAKPSKQQLPGFARNSDTSLAAAIMVHPFVRADQQRILDLFKIRRTWTVDEAVDYLKARNRNCVAPRFTELGPGTESKPGLNQIRDTGERRKVAGQRTGAAVFELNR